MDTFKVNGKMIISLVKEFTRGEMERFTLGTGFMVNLVELESRYFRMEKNT